MKNSTAENLVRSAIAPMISAGVMAAKVSWKMTKVSSGMTTPREKVSTTVPGIDAGEEQLREAADEGVQAAAVGEGERIAVDDPEDGDQREADEHLHQHGKHVLGAHQAAVEKGEAGNASSG